MTAAHPSLAPQPPTAVLSRGPGRLSLRYPACRDRPAFARSLEAGLRALPGVETATVNALTARVRLKFEPERLNPADLSRVLQLGDSVDLVDLTRPASDGRFEWQIHPAVTASIAIGVLEKALLGAAVLTGNPALAATAGVMLLLHHASLMLIALGWLRRVVTRQRAAPPNVVSVSVSTL